MLETGIPLKNQLVGQATNQSVKCYKQLTQNLFMCITRTEICTTLNYPDISTKWGADKIDR